MDTGTKVYLSQQELELACNRDFILTKRTVIDKASHLLSNFSETIKPLITPADFLPEEVKASVPKIYKGENYCQFPYVLLDYPFSFKKENIFAVRTFFWWGNFFSITLQLSASYKTLFEKNIVDNIQLLNNDFSICINKNQWQHHWQADNYVSINSLPTFTIKNIIQEKDFIKIAAKLPVEKWNDAENMLLNNFTALISLLKN
jgi:hypothetical protein